MDQKRWTQFIRWVIGISLIGIGIGVFGSSKGRLGAIALGSILWGIGLALLFVE